MIRSVGTARTQLVRLEHLTDEEIDQIADEFMEIKEQQSREGR